MKRFLLYISLFGFLMSCNDDDPEFGPQESFVRVFNDPSTNLNYHPVAIRQSEDGGYLILSAFDEWETYVMKINSQGRFLWDRLLANNFVNPVGELFQVQDSVFFMCMDRSSREARVFKVNEVDQSIDQFVSYSGLVNPLEVKPLESGEFLVMSFQQDANSFGLSLIDNAFSQRWGRLFETGEDYSSIIENQLRRRVDPLPFFAGALQNGQGFFLNTIYQDSLSLLFTNAATGALTSLIRGENLDKGLSALAHLEGSTFLMGLYRFNQFQIIPQQAISVASDSHIDEYEGRSYPDIKTGTKALVKELNLGGQRVICMANQTKDLNVRINLYDPINGNLLNSKILGQGNPFIIADVAATRDGGLVVLGSTSLAGRLSRIMIIKLSEQEVFDQ